MNNDINMLSTYSLPTFVAGREVTAAQLNTIVEVFKNAIEVLRDRLDYIREFDNGTDYANEGDISDSVNATYKILGYIRDLNSNLTSLNTSYTSYVLSNNNRIGDWSQLYNKNITNIVEALNNLQAIGANNTSSIINIHSLLDGVTVGVIEDLKKDIDTIQQTYATDLKLANEIISLKGAGYTNETIKGNANDIANLNIDLQEVVTRVNNKADLINGVVPSDQLPASLRSTNKGRYPTIEALEAAWPPGSTDLKAGDFAIVATGNTTQFYSWDDEDNSWEPSGFSGTVSSVNGLNPDGEGNVVISTDNISEGANKYYTEDRVSSNPSVAANTNKRSYPLADQTKLSGIENGATAGADWLTNLSNIPDNLVYREELNTYALIGSLAVVATSGNYNDLTNKPTIPTKVSQLSNDSLFVKADTTALLNYYRSGDIDSFLLNKVDKESGKGLSTEDFTTANKTKLDGIEAGAQVNNPNTTIQGNTFNTANKLVQLDSLGKLPAIDGSKLTNLSLPLPLTTKGDLLIHNGSNINRMASGSIGQLLSVDPTSESGLKWIDNPYNSTPTTLLGLLDLPDSYEGKARNVLVVSDNESGMVFKELSEAITGTFTNDSLSGGVLTIRHSFGSAIMPCVITDENNSYMIPNDINYGDGIITVSLTDFLPIAGTWKYAFGTRSITDPDVFDRTFKINNKISDAAGNITLTPLDIGALPDTTMIPTKTSHIENDSGFITNAVNNLINYPKKSELSTVATSGSYNDLTNKPTIPQRLSDLTQDSANRLVTDTEKNTWNNKSNFSGSYNDLTNKPTIPTSLSQLSSDTNNRLVTDTEKNTWNNKQSKLTSGTNIKTINGESLLGSGNILIEGVTDHTLLSNIGSNTHEQIDNHIVNKTNPHSVTKEQVGLGSVSNYSTASQAEAEAGTTNNKYMTPLRTKEAIEKNKTIIIDSLNSDETTAALSAAKGKELAGAINTLDSNKVTGAGYSIEVITEDAYPNEPDSNTLYFIYNPGIYINFWLGIVDMDPNIVDSAMLYINDTIVANINYGNVSTYSGYFKIGTDTLTLKIIRNEGSLKTYIPFALFDKSGNSIGSSGLSDNENFEKDLTNYIQNDMEGNTISIEIHDRGKACLAGDTLIKTSLGYTPIEELKVGDMVSSLNHDLPIIKTFSHKVSKLYNIKVDKEVIKASSTHLFKTTYGFKEASELKVGDLLVTLEGNKRIDTILDEQLTEPINVYEIKTEAGIYLATKLKIINKSEDI